MRHQHTTAGSSETVTARRGRPSLCQPPSRDGPLGPHNLTGIQLLPSSYTEGNGGFEMISPRLHKHQRCWGRNGDSCLTLSVCSSTTLHPRSHVRREIPYKRNQIFPTRYPRTERCPVYVNPRERNLHLLNTSHSTLIISAELKRNRPAQGAGQYHKSMMHWVRPGLVSEAISAPRVWVRQEVKPVVRLTPHGTP